NTGSGEQQINCAKALTTGVWNHIAVTQSGNLGVLYINGVEVGRNASLINKPSSLGKTTKNWIGKSQFPDPTLAGTVDEFRIYKRALTVSEILDLSTLPMPPSTLSASAGNNQITLNWTQSAQAISYNVKRSANIDGPYNIIATV